MQSCCYSLAGTKACENCPNNNKFQTYSTDDLLKELNKHTNVFVKEAYSDDKDKVYVVIVKN